MKGASFKPPPPPPLPQIQLAEDPAFTCTGVDFAGPLYMFEGMKTSFERSGSVFLLVT